MTREAKVYTARGLLFVSMDEPVPLGAYSDSGQLVRGMATLDGQPISWDDAVALVSETADIMALVREAVEDGYQ